MSCAIARSLCELSPVSIVMNTASTAVANNPIPGTSDASPAILTTATSTPIKNTGTMHHGMSASSRTRLSLKKTGNRPNASAPRIQRSTQMCTMGNRNPAENVIAATSGYPDSQVTRTASMSDAACPLPCTNKVTSGKEFAMMKTIAVAITIASHSPAEKRL